ncbi:MAG: orotidine-5'-phosphate decarboxylase [Neisseriaceae bacterium]
MNPLIIDTTINTHSPIIVALDYNNEHDVMNFVAKIDPSLCRLKVGKELFTSCGPKLVEKLVISGYDVFLDLKFHDIPNTVYKACKAASQLGIWMLNVHISGGSEMLKSAKQAIDESLNKPLLIGVTVLTSHGQEVLHEIGIHDNLESHVVKLAKLAFNNQLDGVVCSALESKIIKANTADTFLTITPGIRLTTNKTDDQTRIVTPKQALVDHKVDYMVIGRPITQAEDPYTVLNEIKTQLDYY